jgi:hypothetical protein
MALNKRIFSVILVSTTLATAVAQADFGQIRTQPSAPYGDGRDERGQEQGREGGHGGWGHHGGGGRGNGGGWQPGPVPPPPPPPNYPGNGGYNPNPNPGHGGGYQEQRMVQIQRRVFNENIPLFLLAGIDGRYNGYTVQSVMVYVGRSAPGSQVSLIINGHFEPGAYSPMGPITLMPRFPAVIGQVHDIQLSVAGMADIQYVVINLVRGGRPY